MLLTVSAVAITGGTLVGGAKVYAEHKKKKERPWAYALEKLNKRSNKANFSRINRPVVNGAVLSSYDKLYTKLFGPEDDPSTSSGDQPSLFDKLLAPLLRQQREQQEEITGQKYEKSAEEKRMQRTLAIVSLNMGIAGMSLLYPPLIWLAIPGVLYAWLPFYRLAYQGFKERRASSYVLDLILYNGMLLGGYFYTAVVDGFLGIVALLMIIKSKDDSKQNIMNLFSYQTRRVIVVT